MDENIMKLHKVSYLIVTGFMAFGFMPASALADETPAAQSSTPPKPQEKLFDCHYTGAKDSGDMKAKITKDGSTLNWSDDIGESGPLTILPDRAFSFDYAYDAKDGSKVSGKMNFKVKEDHTLDGTYTDSHDSGKIICTETKQ